MHRRARTTPLRGPNQQPGLSILPSCSQSSLQSSSPLSLALDLAVRELPTERAELELGTLHGRVLRVGHAAALVCAPQQQGQLAILKRLLGKRSNDIRIHANHGRLSIADMLLGLLHVGVFARGSLKSGEGCVRWSKALLGGELVESFCLLQALRNSLSILVAISEDVLRPLMTLIGSLLVPLISLLVALRNTLASTVAKSEVVLCQYVTLIGGLLEPLTCLLVALCNNLALKVANSEAVLRHRITLIGSLLEPLARLLVVLRNTLAIGVASSEVELCLCMALIGGLLEPLTCLLVALRNTLAFIVAISDVVLRQSITLIGSHLVPLICDSLGHAL